MMSDTEKELIELIAEHIPRKYRSHLSPEAALRDLGVDSLGLALIVGEFLRRHPAPVSLLEGRLAKVRTVAELLSVGTLAMSLLGDGDART
jgi:phosphopantetheine binding protein